MAHLVIKPQMSTAVSNIHKCMPSFSVSCFLA